MMFFFPNLMFYFPNLMFYFNLVSRDETGQLQTAVRHADRVISGTLPVSSCDDVFAQVPWAQARAALKHLAQSLKLIAASKEQARTLGN